MKTYDKDYVMINDIAWLALSTKLLRIMVTLVKYYAKCLYPVLFFPNHNFFFFLHSFTKNLSSFLPGYNWISQFITMITMKISFKYNKLYQGTRWYVSFFFFLSFENSLYIREEKICHWCDLQNSFPIWAWLFFLLTMSLTEQKVLILMRLNSLFFFLFWIVLLVSYLRTFFF